MGTIAHKLPSRHLKKGENSCKVRSSLENGGNFVTSLRNISTHPYKSTLLGKLTHKKRPQMESPLFIISYRVVQLSKSHGS